MFFKARSGKLFHDRCDTILRDQDARTDKHSEKGKKGALARWNKNNDIDATAIAQPMPVHATRQDRTRQNNSSPTQAAELIMLPVDWNPTVDHENQCRSLGYDPIALAAAFKSNHKAKGKNFADWDAAFDLWIGNEKTSPNKREDRNMATENEKRLPAARKQSFISKNSQPWTIADKSSLALVIGKVFDLQKQYGKQAGQVENIIDGFCWAMQSYPVELVVKGFGQYILQNSDMPTPSDIVKIIDPKPPEWQPDKAYYIALKDIHKQHGPYGLDAEEVEYIRRYEDYMRKALRDSE